MGPPFSIVTTLCDTMRSQHYSSENMEASESSPSEENTEADLLVIVIVTTK